MASEDQIARRQLQGGEDIIFIQRGGVMTAVMDPQTGQPFPIDEFGTGKGWLAATSNNRVIYGYFGSFGRAKLGGQFPFTSWQDDPRGVAFTNEGIGPEDVCIFIPKTIAPAALHAYMSSALGTEASEPLGRAIDVAQPDATPPASSGLSRDDTDSPPTSEEQSLGASDALIGTSFRVGLAASEYTRAGDPEFGLEAAIAHRFFWESQPAESAGWVATANGAIYVCSGGQVFRIPTDRVRRVGEVSANAFTFSTADREICIRSTDADERLIRFHSELVDSVAAGTNWSDTRLDPSMTVRAAAKEAERNPLRDADEGFLINAALTAGIEDHDLNALWGLRRTLDDEVVHLEDLARLGESYGAGITEASSLDGTAKLRMAMYMVGNYLASYRPDLLAQKGYSYVQEPVRTATGALLGNGSIQFSGLEQVDAFERQHRFAMCAELGIEPPPR